MEFVLKHKIYFMLRVQNVKKKSKSTFKIWRNLGYSTDFTDT